MRIAWRNFKGALYRIELDDDGSIASAIKSTAGASVDVSTSEAATALRLGEVNELAEAFSAGCLKAEALARYGIPYVQLKDIR